MLAEGEEQAEDEHLTTKERSTGEGPARHTRTLMEAPFHGCLVALPLFQIMTEMTGLLRSPILYLGWKRRLKTAAAQHCSACGAEGPATWEFGAGRLSAAGNLDHLPSLPRPTSRNVSWRHWGTGVGTSLRCCAQEPVVLRVVQANEAIAEGHHGEPIPSPPGWELMGVLVLRRVGLAVRCHSHEPCPLLALLVQFLKGKTAHLWDHI